MIRRRILVIIATVAATLGLTAGAAQACWYLDCIEHENGQECTWYWH